MTDSAALSDHERASLHRIFAAFADRIERVAVFGSRALGRARSSSDIDIVLYGSIDDADTARLWSLFDESGLAVRVDLIRYDGLDAGAMKRHIDAYAVPIFDRAALRDVGAA